jgi:hypothetical protein
MMLESSVTALYEAEQPAADAPGDARVMRSEAPRLADMPDLLQAPRLLPGAGEARPATALHSLSVTSAYGEVLASEQVPPSDFAPALRRFYNHAIQHAGAVVILDGITHTRNSFLEFVRAFNECVVRSAQLQAR